MTRLWEKLKVIGKMVDQVVVITSKINRLAMKSSIADLMLGGRRWISFSTRDLIRILVINPRIWQWAGHSNKFCKCKEVNHFKIRCKINKNTKFNWMTNKLVVNKQSSCINWLNLPKLRKLNLTRCKTESTWNRFKTF